MIICISKSFDLVKYILFQNKRYVSKRARLDFKEFDLPSAAQLKEFYSLPGT